MWKDNQSKIIHKDKSLSKGFTIVHNIVLLDERISYQARFLYQLLLMFSWLKGSCFPGQDRLAQIMGVHRNSIRRYLQELKDFKLISWQRRGLNRTNMYYIERLSEIYDQEINQISDAPSIVHPDAQPVVNPDSPSIVHKEYEVKEKKNKNIKLTLNDENKFSSYSEEARELAKEFNDLKSIKYYQKIVSAKDKGEINPDDFYSTLTFIRDQINIQKKDGLSTIRNPASLFVKRLNELIEKRKRFEQQKIYQKQLSKLTEKMTF
ncbi:MAG: helix-turn-helix domain-containing protein [Candidatus Delongbacteria bacterium]|nr:helix-turn-helix domain-containing protein [Candidatus Delongbacteria bacterium]